MRIWNIQKTKQDIGELMCSLLPFILIHAISVCDTTSRMFGIGKRAAYKKFKSSVYIKDLAQKIMTYSTKKDVVQAGEEIIACLYGAVENGGLDLLRYMESFLKFGLETCMFKFKPNYQLRMLTIFIF